MTASPASSSSIRPTYATRRSQLRQLQHKLRERGGPREVVRWAAEVVERRVRVALATVGREGRRRSAERGPRAAIGCHVRHPAPDPRRPRGEDLCVFSGIHGERYNHRDQLFELYPALRGRLEHLYYPTANHTFTELAAQASLLDAVIGWVRERFAS